MDMGLRVSPRSSHHPVEPETPRPVPGEDRGKKHRGALHIAVGTIPPAIASPLCGGDEEIDHHCHNDQRQDRGCPPIAGGGGGIGRLRVACAALSRRGGIGTKPLRHAGEQLQHGAVIVAVEEALRGVGVQHGAALQRRPVPALQKIGILTAHIHHQHQIRGAKLPLPGKLQSVFVQRPASGIVHRCHGDDAAIAAVKGGIIGTKGFFRAVTEDIGAVQNPVPCVYLLHCHGSHEQAVEQTQRHNHRRDSHSHGKPVEIVHRRSPALPAIDLSSPGITPAGSTASASARPRSCPAPPRPRHACGRRPSGW